MKFATLFQKKHIIFGSRIHNTAELFSLAARSFSEGMINPDEIENALQHRESLGSTYIGNGVMIPHAHLDDLEDHILGYIRPEKPFLLAGNETVKHIFIFVSSRDQATFHLKLLKAISEVTTRHLDLLDKARNAEQFINAINDTDIELESHLRASDFMCTVMPIRENDSLSKAVDMMKEQNLSYVPVVDENGFFIGTVDFLDILSTSMPDYVMRLSDLSFISDLEPIKQFLHKERTLSVKPYIKNVNTMIVPVDASYVEVLFLMAKYKHRYLISVDKNGLFSGLIRSVDVISRILRA